MAPLPSREILRGYELVESSIWQVLLLLKTIANDHISEIWNKVETIFVRTRKELYMLEKRKLNVRLISDKIRLKS